MEKRTCFDGLVFKRSRLIWRGVLCDRCVPNGKQRGWMEKDGEGGKGQWTDGGDYILIA
jgi:hypothetical protein